MATSLSSSSSVSSLSSSSTVSSSSVSSPSTIPTFTLDVDQFCEAVDNEYTCFICTHVLQVPVQCSSGHIYCKSCIDKWLTQGKSDCPSCRTPLTPATLIRSLVAEKVIDKMMIWCEYNVSGEKTRTIKKRKTTPSTFSSSPPTCVWAGPVSDYSRHLTTCPLALLPCTHKENGCLEQIARYQQSSHAQNCDYRTEMCTYCHTEQKRPLSEHLNTTCRSFPIECPNQCLTATFPRETLPAHLIQCPEHLVPCIFEKMGCPQTEIKRQNLVLHIAENQASHLTMIAERYTQLQQDYNRLQLQRNEDRYQWEQVTVNQYASEFVVTVKEDQPTGQFVSANQMCCGLSWYVMYQHNRATGQRKLYLHHSTSTAQQKYEVRFHFVIYPVNGVTTTTNLKPVLHSKNLVAVFHSNGSITDGYGSHDDLLKILGHPITSAEFEQYYVNQSDKSVIIRTVISLKHPHLPMMTMV